MIGKVIQRFWWKLRRPRRAADAEFAAEIESHIAMQIEDNVRAGMAPDEARRTALVKFGGLEPAKESHRDARGWPVLEMLWRDVWFALRSFRRRPAFAFVAVLSLALGIGSASAVFSVVDRVLFRSLPYEHADRLVSVGIVEPMIFPQDWLFSRTYQEWRDSGQGPFEAVTSWLGINDCDLTGETAARLDCARVESTFRPVVGVKPLLGRNFTAEEDKDGAPAVALISFGVWQSRFGGDGNVVGRRLMLDGAATEVIGVLPANFELPTLGSADIVMPQKLKRTSERQRVVRAIARLPKGLSTSRAAALVEPAFQSFVDSTPDDFRKATSMRLRVEPLKQHQMSEYRLASWTLLAAVLGVMAIACANVSNLLLTQMAARARELAIRRALGASRLRLFSQRMTDAVLLGLLGGLFGLALASVLVMTASRSGGAAMPRLTEASMDLRVFAFGIAAAVVSGVLVGLVPSVGLRSQRRLLAGQVAVTLVLLTCSGLLLASLRKMQTTSAGVRADHVVTAAFTLNRVRYADNARQIAFFEQLEQRLRELPGVTAVAITDSLPPGGDPRSKPFVALIGGGDRSRPDMTGVVLWRYVSPDYHAALGIPIVRGRAFTESDRSSEREIVILNQALATRLFPAGQDPVGKTIGTDLVVGIATDARNEGFSPVAQPEFYSLRRRDPGGVYSNQRPPYGWRRAIAVVRTSMEHKAAADFIRSSIAGLDPALPFEIGSLEQHFDTFLDRPRFTSSVLSLFSAIALVLAAVGLYGVISYLVVERTREIGLRMALGAGRSSVLRTVLLRPMMAVAIGFALGLIGSLGAGRLLRGLLFGIGAHDPSLLSGAVLAFCCVAGLAAWIPARRATRVDPAVALRHD
jgi:putative ABC transport system permease protein